MKNKKNVIAIIVAVAAVIAIIVLDIADIAFSKDETVNAIISLTLSRAIASVAVTAAILLIGLKGLFAFKLKGFLKLLLWGVPCFLVVLANFPFVALIKGEAVVSRAELIPLYILYCFFIGYLEETLFRGLLQDTFASCFRGRKRQVFLTVLCTSAVFAVFHILNLFEGADIGSTLLQVGYSFLTGAMFSAVMIRGGNLWLCIFLHAAFDFGGSIVDMLGYGNFQDGWFWAFTAVAGVICAVYIVRFIILKDREKGAENDDTSKQT